MNNVLDYDTIATIKNDNISSIVRNHLISVYGVLKDLGYEHATGDNSMYEFIVGKINVRKDFDGTTCVRINSRIKKDEFQRDTIIHCADIDQKHSVSETIQIK